MHALIATFVTLGIAGMKIKRAMLSRFIAADLSGLDAALSVVGMREFFAITNIQIHLSAITDTNGMRTGKEIT